MIYKRPSTAENKIVIIFEIPGSVWAEHIHLVGDFNNWDRKSLPFRHTRQDTWQVQLELERGKEYRFRYLIDGLHWQSDRQADQYAAGPDGVHDSIVIAQLPPAG